MIFRETSLPGQILIRLGSDLMRGLHYMGGMMTLFVDVLRALVSRRFEWGLVWRQILEIGVNSLSLTNLIGVFTGAVLALQFIIGLRRFGLELYSGQVVGIAITRELGPVLTSLMIAARVGSGITAELGSMTVSEQVMAIRSMGASPVAKLVIPRVFVVMLAAPLLTAMADLIGVLGGMLVTHWEAGIAYTYYWDQVTNTVQARDFVTGVLKTVFFGFSIGMVACYNGLTVSGGTKGVGRATTSTVVQSSVVIFISDYVLTKLFLIFE